MGYKQYCKEPEKIENYEAAKKGKPKSEEARRKMKGKNIWIKGTHWYNNGKINIRAYEYPDGFVPGQLR